ncbi:hypothetical protein ZIOFF_069518 [Zingiber officinale]|uniref:Uncharacterized protein n=1 Tax=Zingiber officinale TaxID=94328 RepID=A0A8J5C3Y6_ZINOF|nr:hypothetical protein ZIOFF_069518 [Zingiber officinale]
MLLLRFHPWVVGNACCKVYPTEAGSYLFPSLPIAGTSSDAKGSNPNCGVLYYKNFVEWNDNSKNIDKHFPIYSGVTQGGVSPSRVNFSRRCCSGIEMFESSAQTTEPHKLSSLGYPHKGKSSPPSLSACDILSQSDYFKSLLEKSLNSADNKDDPSQLKMDQRTVPLFSSCGLGTSGVSLVF